MTGGREAGVTLGQNFARRIGVDGQHRALRGPRQFLGEFARHGDRVLRQRVGLPQHARRIGADAAGLDHRVAVAVVVGGQVDLARLHRDLVAGMRGALASVYF